MSFLGDVFSGASNNFTPQSAFAPGTQATTQNFQPAIQQGNQNYNQATSGEFQLASALQNQMYGIGPNPAQAQLQQATAANTANQASLMAGQRGAASNVGLIARQAGQQGAANQQASVGQAATLGAQQQLNAQSQLGNVYGNVAGQANSNLGINQGAQQAQNSAIAGQTSANNTLGAGIAQQNANTNQGLIGGVSNAGMALLAHGGAVPHYATGGVTSQTQTPQVMNVAPGLSKANFGFNFANRQPPNKDPMAGAQNITPSGYAGIDMGAQMGGDNLTYAANGGMMLPFAPMARGGKVKAMVSPGEIELKPSEVKDVAQGANPLQIGDRIPGKPVVKGDSLKNDIVRKDLDEGGIIIPRTKAKSEEDAKQFVAKTIREKGQEPDFKGALQRAIATRKSK